MILKKSAEKNGRNEWFIHGFTSIIHLWGGTFFEKARNDTNQWQPIDLSDMNFRMNTMNHVQGGTPRHKKR